MRSCLDRRRISLLLAIALVSRASSVLAQEPPPLDLPSERPGEVPFREDEPVEPEVQEPKGEEEARTSLGSVRAFELRRLRLVGNTVLDERILRERTAPWMGQRMGQAELEALREAVTRIYVDRGYVTSGAVVPDQDLANGELVLLIVEGRIARVRIEGLRRLRERYVRSRIWPDRQAPVRMDRLSTRLSVLQADPDIRSVRAELRPGDRLGESELIVRIEEGRHYDLALEANNHRSPVIGSQTGELRGALRNRIGVGDRILARGQVSEGLWDVEIEAAAPLFTRGPEFGVRFRYSDSEVVEAPFDSLDIESDFLTAGGRLTQTVWETFEDRVQLGVQLEWRRSRTTVAGTGFSFSEGVDEGESVVVPLRLEASWTRRQRAQVVALRSLLSIGLPILDYTNVRGSEADATFVSWLLQGQLAHRFERLLGSELIIRGDLQLASDPLLPIEQLSVGGHASVRGFRENQVVRDEGFDLSLELRVPVWTRVDGSPIVQVAPFFDVGRGWQDGGRDSSRGKTLAAAGAGLRLFPFDGLRASLYWGQRITKADRPRNDKDPQDYGIHFAVTLELP